MKASIPSMMTVPTTNWPPGSYPLRLDASTGVQSYVPITIRSPSVARTYSASSSSSAFIAFRSSRTPYAVVSSTVRPPRRRPRRFPLQTMAAGP